MRLSHRLAARERCIGGRSGRCANGKQVIRRIPTAPGTLELCGQTKTCCTRIHRAGILAISRQPQDAITVLTRYRSIAPHSSCAKQRVVRAAPLCNATCGPARRLPFCFEGRTRNGITLASRSSVLFRSGTGSICRRATRRLPTRFLHRSSLLRRQV
jgi:hypothetical protein